MLINYNKHLRDFEFWGGAEDFVKNLTLEELTKLEGILDNMYSEGINATTLNDLFCFNEGIIANWLGTTVEEIYNRYTCYNL